MGSKEISYLYLLKVELACWFSFFEKGEHSPFYFLNVKILLFSPRKAMRSFLEKTKKTCSLPFLSKKISIFFISGKEKQQLFFEEKVKTYQLTYQLLILFSKKIVSFSCEKIRIANHVFYKIKLFHARMKKGDFPIKILPNFGVEVWIFGTRITLKFHW